MFGPTNRKFPLKTVVVGIVVIVVLYSLTQICLDPTSKISPAASPLAGITARTSPAPQKYHDALGGHWVTKDGYGKDSPHHGVVTDGFFDGRHFIACHRRHLDIYAYCSLALIDDAKREVKATLHTDGNFEEDSVSIFVFSPDMKSFKELLTDDPNGKDPFVVNWKKIDNDNMPNSDVLDPQEHILDGEVP
jgi:hypothetical protein